MLRSELRTMKEQKLTEKYKPYRSSFGLLMPPIQTEVIIYYLSGCQFMIIWKDCPDLENVLYGWITKKAEAETICKLNGWIIVEYSKTIDK